MKIVFVVPNMGFGGAERVISILANSFVNKGYEIKILIINSDGESVYNLNPKIEIEKIPSASIKNIYSMYKLIKSIRRIVSKYNPDVIISFMNDTCAITSLATIGMEYPIIYSERNDPLNTNQGTKDRMYRYIVERLAKGFVFQSDGAKALYPKRVQDNAVVILNPIDTRKLPSYYSGERKKEIVSVGRLQSQKNQEMLIKAYSNIANKYPEYNLIIYGEGDLRESLQQKIECLGLKNRIFLKGNISNVLDEINKASIFAFSSDYEGLPNALIEAMALGLPCISTDCSPGGAAMLINNYENGILVPTGDEKNFAAGLSYLLSHPSNAIDMGIKARRIVERTKESNIVSDWENYILLITQKGNIKK
ncbi:glycosyltransferase family 4 protein [Bacillus bombysepticus]|nr:glycosyltransferase family 4 protein [Bacillus bombysepticus]